MQTSQIIQLPHLQDRWHSPEVMWVSIVDPDVQCIIGVQSPGDFPQFSLECPGVFPGLTQDPPGPPHINPNIFSTANIYAQVTMETSVTGPNKAYPVPFWLVRIPSLANNCLSPSLVFLICSSGRLGTMVDRLFMHEIFLYSYKKAVSESVLFYSWIVPLFPVKPNVCYDGLFFKNVFLFFPCFPTLQLNVLESWSTI